MFWGICLEMLQKYWWKLIKLQPVRSLHPPLETTSPIQQEEMTELLAYQPIFQEDPTIPSLVEELYTEHPDLWKHHKSKTGPFKVSDGTSNERFYIIVTQTAINQINSLLYY